MACTSILPEISLLSPEIEKAYLKVLVAPTVSVFRRHTFNFSLKSKRETGAWELQEQIWNKIRKWVDQKL